MHSSLKERLGAFPLKLYDLQTLEDDLHDISLDNNELEWNRKRQCVEHRFSEEWEVEFAVLQHWADHVGARFEMTDDLGRDGFYHAFIYR